MHPYLLQGAFVAHLSRNRPKFCQVDFCFMLTLMLYQES
ncbi:hypothetical protein XBP1_690002 [Xenorhabdus bovienii str. puntauvense]|uniref:Uncharacterized protein n=1 Tax=Xenorhabdus bovienii str. puntauvense TaxID=1398201 RepID=A0A077NKD7_XENBV|nr:hypothetical protein XBFFR1_430002 [Xenorhabdus bovienii str. feltiae France]CDG94616.1 hypothetical protein XBFFL1_780002 [Xenorhabdus bovienii str. feltiae Florida]CDG99018.1 hypothetical protein XBP1_690002 [Xenorhabdus bovienii str. puntauvense]